MLRRLLLSLCLVWSVCWSAPDQGAVRSAPTEWLIKFHSVPHQLDRFLGAYNLIERGQVPHIKVRVVTSRSAAARIDLDQLARDPAVEWIEPNGLLTATGVITPSDEYYAAQQLPYLTVMRVPEAWTLTIGDTQPVAVIDTGLDIDHPDLTGKIWTNPDEIPGNNLDDDANGYIDDVMGWNFVSNTNVPQDNNGHGSHVAGSIAASSNNGQGIAGIAWPATIIPIKALNGSGVGTYANIAAAIIYAADEGARIINLSLGGALPPQTVRLAVEYAQQHGCLVIASAGNDGLDSIDYPAALPDVVAVAATTNLDEWWFEAASGHGSNYGPQIALAAPGKDIFSANSTGGYYADTGTSMSTAHVSGVAALVWARQPALSAAAVTRILTETAHDVNSLGWDPYTGWGRIDAYRAVVRAEPYRQYLPLIHHP